MGRLTTLDFSELILVDTLTSCDSCNGACCREMDSPPFCGDEWQELETCRPDLFHELNAELDRRMHAATWTEGNPCFWLDQATGRCKHYEDRPEIRRDFMPGGIACIGSRKLYGIDENKGDSRST